MFWVGLLEGDGTITVDNPNNRNKLRVRIVIALAYSLENEKMLVLIAKVVGGKVNTEYKKNTKYIV